MNVVMKVDSLTLKCMFNDTNTARAIVKALPINSTVNVWGEEIYFNIPVHLDNEIPTRTVAVGDIAFWPDDDCLCVFFGKTPMSKGNAPEPYSDVTIVGKVCSDLLELRKIQSGARVSVMVNS